MRLRLTATSLKRQRPEERVNNVVVSCEKLGTDKKIPKKVLDTFIVAHRTISIHTSTGAN